MEFTYDLSQTPIIGRRHHAAESRPKDPFTAAATAGAEGDGGKASGSKEDKTGGASSPRRSVSLSSADSSTISCWKRPWLSQVWPIFCPLIAVKLLLNVYPACRPESANL